MHPQIATAAASPPAPPSGPPTTLEAHILNCLSIRERALRIVRIADREVLHGIARLDADDGDADLEPSVGQAPGGALDAEADHADDEFSLGAPENHPAVGGRTRRRGPYRTGEGNQTSWVSGLEGDLEAVDEDGDPLDRGEQVNEDGDPLDKGEGDDFDWELTLGWSEDIDQRSLNATDDREPCGAGENVSQVAWGRDTEVAAIVVGEDGGETIVRHIGDPLKGLRVISSAMEAGRTVREVLFKRMRGSNITPLGNIVPVDWVRH